MGDLVPEYCPGPTAESALRLHMESTGRGKCSPVEVKCALEALPCAGTLQCTARNSGVPYRSTLDTCPPSLGQSTEMHRCVVCMVRVIFLVP